ncbi:hypothetical protein HJG60_010421 [Phyllostomus discolor]|uniref:Uncharacterized protein n=1 Tax=Phyllostomus discolor TaxID=89673 RepID=A0A834B2S1_9CHIR|nr:hypothetical protein HJG60_010421 [Phyllostomus discolor]
MLIYCNAIKMKQGSCSICTVAFMIHHDSALFLKAGTTCPRTGSLSYINVLYLSSGAPLEFSPDYFLPQIQACAVTGSGIGDLLLGRRTPSPLSHTNQSHCSSLACVLTRDQTCKLISNPPPKKTCRDIKNFT